MFCAVGSSNRAFACALSILASTSLRALIEANLPARYPHCNEFLHFRQRSRLSGTLWLCRSGNFKTRAAIPTESIDECLVHRYAASYHRRLACHWLILQRSGHALPRHCDVVVINRSLFALKEFVRRAVEMKLDRVNLVVSDERRHLRNAVVVRG